MLGLGGLGGEGGWERDRERRGGERGEGMVWCLGGSSLQSTTFSVIDRMVYCPA